MADVQIQAGSLYADLSERIVTGLLLPYGELGQTNLGKFSVKPGAVTIPSDPDVVTLNVQHEREEPVGRAVELTETPAGIVGTFRIAKTVEGDTVLAEIAEGTRSKLSAEVKNVVIRSREAVAGVLFGAAVVEQGAFPSAALMAEYAADTESEAKSMADTLKAEIVEVLEESAETIEVVAEDAPAEVVVDTVDPETGEVTSTTYEPVEVDTQEEEEMGAATAPETLQAQKAAPQVENLSVFVKNMSSAARTGSPSMFAEIAKTEGAQAATSLFAALDDIAFDGVGSVGVNTAQPQWLGELWLGKMYERKYIPLIGSAALTNLTMDAWRWTTKPAVAEWDGNKAAVPTNTPATEPVTVTAQRYAGAHDWAREFRDFGRTDVIESALRLMTESYAKITDEATLTGLVDGATEVEQTGSTVWEHIMDGVEAVYDVATPTFAILAKDLYRELILTEDSAKLAYLAADLGLDGGTGAGFRIMPSAGLTAGTLIVGAREAATSYELGGAPIRVEATNVVNGGFDIGLFGYHAVHVGTPLGIASVVPPVG